MHCLQERFTSSRDPKNVSLYHGTDSNTRITDFRSDDVSPGETEALDQSRERVFTQCGISTVNKNTRYLQCPGYRTLSPSQLEDFMFVSM